MNVQSIHPDTGPAAVIRGFLPGKLWRFTGLQEIIQAGSTDEVWTKLQQASRAVEEKGLYAAGFVSYEAAPAFDPYFQVRRDDSRFPPLWFGLFSGARELELGPAEHNYSMRDIKWEASISREEYNRSLAEIRNHIRQGDTYQVNFTYRLHAPLSFDPWKAFKVLFAAQNPPCGAYIDTGEFALCSFSPELFFSLECGLLRSRPMKGTAARGLWSKQDHEMAAELYRSEKDRAENVMIVDMVRNDMGRIAAPGSVQVPELFTLEKYPDVWQMTSLVQAETTSPLEKIFQALFPPASITGAPKINTMEIIARLESLPRRIYTGTIGFMAPGGKARFNVAIRTLLADRRLSLAEYGVGGGIVWDSSAEREMDESRIKARVLQSRREAFDLLESILWDPEKGFPFLEYHLERLQASADYFDFSLNTPLVHEHLDTLAQSLPRIRHKIRLLVSRSGAVKAEASSLTPETSSFSDIPLAAVPVDPRDRFLYHKTTRRIVYEQALKSRSGFRDVLLFNTGREVTESTIANIVVEKDNELLTPPVNCGLLPGVYRSLLIRRNKVRERVLSIDDVQESTSVYLINAVRGMHPVRILF